jgi:signal transduction histidine kinase/ActR/RegA family two-component response regulator
MAVGWLRLVGQDLNWYDTAFGAALRTLVETALFAAFSWWIVLRIRDYEIATHDAERRKDEFLALLAHELRNPLAPVMNTLGLLELERSADPELRSALSLMRRQMTHMVRLVDDLLDVSRISRGKLELRKQPTDLAAAVQQAVEMNQPLAQQLGHQVEVSLTTEPLHVDGDTSRLTQAVGNVLNNACRYTPPSGRITVRAERRGGEAIVTITDTGIGIPAEKLGEIFEMFTQLDASLERTSGGLGIGLHLVRELIEMHGGQVHAQSSGPGKGSEFRIHLPLLPEPVARLIQPPRPLDQAASQQARILVVDDNRDSALTLSLLLKKRGNQVQTAYDGEEAVSQAASFQPDVILLDIGLPKLNGYDVCRAIRAQASNEDLLIIALTGWGQEEDRRQAQVAGFDAHLTKPVDHGLLASTLADLQRRTAKPGH